MQIEIQKLCYKNIEQFIELIDIFEEVFEMNNFELPVNKHLESILDNEEFLAFVAVYDGEIVGGLTAYILHQYYSESPLVYIYDLAVMKKYQRKGIGKKLILGIKDYCKEIGVKEVFVQADEADVHALDFYRSTGAKETKVTHFSYPLN